MLENAHREQSVNIEAEMRSSYLDYAMSVIIGRALPDVRDGLKPVHRRVLYSMEESSTLHNRPYKKSARIVGDVIGKYHPHGDVAVYDALVRMAQDFSMRETLIDGQGNFGSVDGDSPAAMRYTEVRMAQIAEELLSDIDKETVDFQPNYDESLQEPQVLPSRFPNLLVNGASGIAVGMATKIPPHNLSEVVDGLLHLLDQPEATPRQLMQFIPGPDFPTGGFICGRSGIEEAYLTGRGIFQIRAKTSFEEIGKKREAITISELPFQVNKARLIEKIAQLVTQKRIRGISDLRDESDRRGMRVVIELKKGEHPQVVLNTLFKLTAMQLAFGTVLLAIVEGRPRILNLKQVLQLFLEHRKEIVTRRSTFDLSKAQEREHILEGLQKALDHLEEIIGLIRKSPSPTEARQQLMATLDFTPKQAQAILQMRLQRLTGLERQKILQERQQQHEQIKLLKSILSDESVLASVIREELQQIQRRYRSNRRTEIVDYEVDLTAEDLIPEEPMVISATQSGYIKRTSLSAYRSQHRGGKGRIGMSTRIEEDVIDYLFVASTHSYILTFLDSGRMHWLKVWTIPHVGTGGKGKPIVNLIDMQPTDKACKMIPIQDLSRLGYVVMTSRAGYIKRTAIAAFAKPRRAGIIACSVDPGDQLIGVQLSTGHEDILLFTRHGQAIRFRQQDVRAMGRTARGVRGVSLRQGDEVVDMAILSDANADILAVTENGFGKRTPVLEYRLQGRGGKGVINISTSARNGRVVATCQVTETSEVILITENGKLIRLEAGRIRQTVTRSAQGVKLIDLEAGDRVAAVGLVPVEDAKADTD